jgi:hypothetical protein
MVRMVKKISALNTFNIQTYFNEHDELNLSSEIHENVERSLSCETCPFFV